MQRAYDVLGRTLELARADITRLAVDAIVSSENSDLVMDRPDGPSVSAAIRRLEGEDLARDLARLGPIDPGRAVVTPARRLPCRWVIHAATVVRTEAGHESSLEVLREAVRSAMRLAAGLGLRSLAFPAFGVRAAAVPREAASRAMVEEIVAGLRERTPLRRVVVALLDPEAFLAFFEVAAARAAAASEPLRLRVQRRAGELTWTFDDAAPLAHTAARPMTADDEAEVRDLVARLRGAGARRLLDARAALDALGARLGRLVPGEVLARAAREAPRPLVLALDEDLAGLPFELARDEGGALAERTAVSRRLIVSRPGPAGEAGAARPAGRLEGLLLPGGPDLPHAGREAARLLDLLWRRAGDRLGLRLLAGPRATRRDVLEALPRAGLVHWCGHTRAGPDGARWALPSGEVVTADDLLAARLTARLVVTSSCGHGDDLPLARALLLGGARNVVTALWEVEDAAAERFALHLYEALALGRTLGEALAEARAALAPDDPLHAAAFVHYGDPRERVVEPVGLV
ncbi:MAG: CHAT domain-containing protein [Planctomycetes bacterium]|nr:CHAT domain-containing protein [Planctomycetota bacterium]